MEAFFEVKEKGVENYRGGWGELVIITHAITYIAVNFCKVRNSNVERVQNENAYLLTLLRSSTKILTVLLDLLAIR